MRDLMLERFLDFLEERHGQETVRCVLDELGDMTGTSVAPAHGGIGERGQRLRAAAEFASMALASNRAETLRAFGGWLIDHHTFGWVADVRIDSDLTALGRRLAAVINGIIESSNAMRLADHATRSEKVTLVYRDEAGWADIVQGAIDTWLRVHAPEYRLARSDLSHVCGTHVQFCLHAPHEIRQPAHNTWPRHGGTVPRPDQTAGRQD
ncbi:MAG: hypothetical protein R3D03_08570 [Geminicoccaceae bacterium]